MRPLLEAYAGRSEEHEGGHAGHAGIAQNFEARTHFLDALVDTTFATCADILGFLWSCGFTCDGALSRGRGGV